MELLVFVVISIGLILTPGPNVLVIVSTSIAHGSIRGLQTVVGTSLAMILQLCVAIFATTWFVSALTQGLIWLKWVGVAYLIYLGAKGLLSALRKTDEVQALSGAGSFSRGFYTSITNPKTMLFFSAFLPQFVGGVDNYLLHIIVLSLVFWNLAVVIDSGYALLASRLSRWLKNYAARRWQQGICGVLYLGAAGFLASSKTH